MEIKEGAEKEERQERERRTKTQITRRLKRENTWGKKPEKGVREEDMCSGPLGNMVF